MVAGYRSGADTGLALVATAPTHWSRTALAQTATAGAADAGRDRPLRQHFRPRTGCRARCWPTDPETAGNRIRTRCPRRDQLRVLRADDGVAVRPGTGCYSCRWTRPAACTGDVACAGASAGTRHASTHPAVGPWPAAVGVAAGAAGVPAGTAAELAVVGSALTQRGAHRAERKHVARRFHGSAHR